MNRRRSPPSAGLLAPEKMRDLRPLRWIGRREHGAARGRAAPRPSGRPASWRRTPTPMAICSVRSGAVSVRLRTSNCCADVERQTEEAGDDRQPVEPDDAPGIGGMRRVGREIHLPGEDARFGVARREDLQQQRWPPPGSGDRSRSLTTRSVGAGVSARTNSARLAPPGVAERAPSDCAVAFERQVAQPVDEEAAESRRRDDLASGLQTTGRWPRTPPVVSSSASASRSRRGPWAIS